MVSLEFNTNGARKFADLTGANVNKRMAIVLDDIVNSAPVIQARIAGGRCTNHFRSEADKVMRRCKWRHRVLLWL